MLRGGTQAATKEGPICTGSCTAGGAPGGAAAAHLKLSGHQHGATGTKESTLGDRRVESQQGGAAR